MGGLEATSETDLRAEIAEMATAAAANGTGIVFLVDEMQLLGRGDLEALCAAAHRANQDGRSASRRRRSTRSSRSPSATRTSSRPTAWERGTRRRKAS